MGSGSKRRRGALDDGGERAKNLHKSFANAANAVAGLYSAAVGAQKSASAAGARAVLVRFFVWGGGKRRETETTTPIQRRKKKTKRRQSEEKKTLLPSAAFFRGPFCPCAQLLTLSLSPLMLFRVPVAFNALCVPRLDRRRGGKRRFFVFFKRKKKNALTKTKTKNIVNSLIPLLLFSFSLSLSRRTKTKHRNDKQSGSCATLMRRDPFPSLSS